MATVPSAAASTTPAQRRRHPAGLPEEGRGGRGGERAGHRAAPGQRAQQPGGRGAPRRRSADRRGASAGWPPGPARRRAATRIRTGRRGTTTRQVRASGLVGSSGWRPGPAALAAATVRQSTTARTGAGPVDTRPGTQRAGAVIPRDDDPGRGTARPLPSDGRWALCGTARCAGRGPSIPERFVRSSRSRAEEAHDVHRSAERSSVRRQERTDCCNICTVTCATSTRKCQSSSSHTCTDAPASSSVTCSGTTTRQSARASEANRCDGGPPISRTMPRTASSRPRRNCRRPAGEVQR